MLRDDYIPRSVDGDCLRALRAGRNFYVFGPPRTGKTRLRRRMADALRASGLRVAEIDLAHIGQGAFTGDVWFELARSCAAGFGLGDAHDFWRSYAALAPAERWQRYLQSVPAGSPVVLLVDSLERLIADGYDIEAFFSALCPGDVVGRTPLVTCLFGSIHRLDLGLDIRTASLKRSPLRGWFRTAVELRPAPFTTAEAEGFLPRLAAPGGDARALLGAILDWTDGHPGLTATLVDAIGDGGPLMISGSEAVTVAATVEALFLEAPIAGVPTFAMAEAWADCTDPAATARWWRRLLQGEAPGWRPGDEAHRQLRMGGLVRVDGAVLRPACRLFTAVFDEAWCDARLMAEGLPARARAWIESGRAPTHLLEGDALRRASAWAEGRDAGPEIGELLLASWVRARRAEAAVATEPPARVAPPAVEPPSEVRVAPPPSLAVPPPAHPRALRWLAAAVVLMGLVTTGLLVALWQARSVREAPVAAQPEPAPERVSALEAALARAEARVAELEARAVPMDVDEVAEEPVATAARSTAGAAAPERARAADARQGAERRRAAAAREEARIDAREAAAQEAERRRAVARAKAREARRAATARRAAERRAAERRAAERRAAERRAAERRAAERRAAERRAAERRAAAREKARRHARARPAAEPSTRPGPIPAPAPAAAIARQAPTYRRSLTRCKHYDLPQRVRLQLTVQPDGRVAQATVAGGADGRVDVGCLVESARRFRFAPFAGQTVTAAVDYRL